MENKMPKKGSMTRGWVYWTPRMLSIVFVLFLALMSLDVFEMGLGFWETLLGLFMHNIPAIILAIIVAIAWRYEIVGGIAFILAGLLYIVMAMWDGFEWYKLAWIVQLSGISFFIGILFLVGWKRRKK